MDCVILKTLYLKANGVFPCHDDGIARPDVRRAFPRLRSERVGFAATFKLRHTLGAAFDFELHAEPQGSTRSQVFTVQVSPRESAPARDQRHP